jgi:Uncharacterized protein conserved in bacteria
MANTGMIIGESINPGKGELASLLQRVRKWLLIAAGTTCVGLGFIGIFLPVLPTTPFLLLAAVCYAGSSPRFYRWLLENRLFGQYIKNYREGRGITLTAKIVSVTSMCAAIGFSAYFFVPWLAGKLVLLAIAVGVSAHILTRPTCK